ncbi:unnamed protein product [Adineta steineri]|uniref:Uncharacterized protein n=1 Tax=Adineta steineri TaxID=433720 RepID=A0A815NX01_9BILA|nr:unnamed protein product [Adineta steineri]
MIRRRLIPNQTVNDEQSELHQFQFNITETNETDEQITIDAEKTSLNDGDSQQQQQNLPRLRSNYLRLHSNPPKLPCNSQELQCNSPKSPSNSAKLHRRS